MIILLMGTTGAGKTTVGEMLAARLSWTFLDADKFHPAANIAKMSQGIMLSDADRQPWLQNIHGELLRFSSSGKNAVLACSALKQSYRETLAAGVDLRIVYLRGTYEQMGQRIKARHGHFAGEGILAGQFADLEAPSKAVVLEASRSPAELVSDILSNLQLES
jgi:carbohydrate kinase (thermoresistant glucokinase family)